MTGPCPGCGERHELNRRVRFRCHALASGEQCPGSCREPGQPPAEPEPPEMSAPCPHPEKARYATAAMAPCRALGRPAIAGLVLIPYRCCCGWHHLTKNPQPSDAVRSQR